MAGLAPWEWGRSILINSQIICKDPQDRPQHKRQGALTRVIYWNKIRMMSKDLEKLIIGHSSKCTTNLQVDKAIVRSLYRAN